MNETTSEPKVYWNVRHRVFFGKYKHGGTWKTKTVPVSIESKESATLWFKQWMMQLLATGVGPTNDEVKTDQRKTVRNLAERWLAWRKEALGPDKKSYKGCEQLLRKWVYPHRIADADLETDLDLGLCTEWIEWVKKAKKASYTTRNIVQGLRGFVVDARGKGWIRVKENPLLDPYIKKVLGGADTVAGKNTIIHLKKEEVVTLFTSTSPKVPAVRKVKNVIAIATGCRLGELQALTWRDIDMKATIPTARVFRQLTVPGTNATACFKDPKRKSHRILPIHPLALQALKWWHDTGWREHVGVDPRADDPVFPNIDGEFTFGHGARSFRDDLIAAGLPELFDGRHRFTFHACRRTFMSLLEAEGVPRETIGALAGHSSKSVTDRHYIAKNIDRFADAVSKLPLGDVIGLGS